VTLKNKEAHYNNAAVLLLGVILTAVIFLQARKRSFCSVGMMQMAAIGVFLATVKPKTPQK
jgi:hypothetical protein